MSSFNLDTLVRPNILTLEPYRCARDDFKEGILLDANENAYGPSLTDLSQYESTLELNRYPDPHQLELKQKIVDFRNGENKYEISKNEQITPENLCLGVGSDESIDALIRTVCVPGKDKLLIAPPTYGMYSISSTINDVEIVKVPLDFEKFQIQPDLINEILSKDSSIKLVYITTPGNPTGASVDFSLIEKVLSNPNWNGLVVADEAYVDFAPIGSSLSTLVEKYPNLVVLQTVSKSFGLAGIRLGITFANKRLSSILNALKAPYNISSLTSDIASRSLSPEGIKLMRQRVEILNSERSRLWESLQKFKNIGKLIGGLDANFLLIEVIDENGKPSSPLAKQFYEKLATTKGVVVRYRGGEPGCSGGLRITVGTKEENDALSERFQVVAKEL
ncbi:Histidinol-phosphate aminotransferase [Wickerhamomyces ciferrii]|uniref:histidinol-phosphate transaminase n=1 Tax=Wickerhamomyces ciferrii (strain ATCC 14091 / BCRC 22168 / CBS 111 / JCM 3599 / NBRC 0793 / NRRL Y-1031 F-60-10) TaxID=1206466 RepID=K0KKN8_WICCF|nr:Histidinol-phosphate aminotransferase [Wickerhamomyces ciferrii]CCH43561.1 Histidinol-phosphate aminotransferase [Wickerhamomyces ciferrii]